MHGEQLETVVVSQHIVSKQLVLLEMSPLVRQRAIVLQCCTKKEREIEQTGHCVTIMAISLSLILKIFLVYARG